MPTSKASSFSLDADLGFGERAIPAAGAALISAILVNRLDVAQTRLQAQAAGVLYNLSQQHGVCRGIHGSGSFRTPDCFRYKGRPDVFYKVIRQKGFARLWRGTNASLALATNFIQKITNWRRPPGMWKTLLGILSPNRSTNYIENHKKKLAWVGEEGKAASILGANFSAGFLAGSLAAAATCPLDVGKTRHI